jgi:hypothetical protein
MPAFKAASRLSPASCRAIAAALGTIPFALVLGFSSAVGFAGEDYRIEIDGNSFDIGLDEVKNLRLPGGQNLSIRLTQKEYIIFESQYFSFSHKNEYKPNRTDLGNGIFQTVITTALGSVVLIQEYTNFDPTEMVGIILKEFTKEEVEYGFKYEERKVSRIVGNIELRGREAITTYKDTRWTRVVYTYGKKDSGVLIATIIEKDNVATDKHLISHLWKTLKINL